MSPGHEAAGALPPAPVHITAGGLLRHELRLVVRHMKLDGWASDRSGFAALLFLVGLLLHVFPGPLALMFPANTPDMAPVRIVAGAFAMLILALIGMTALSRSVEALFERSDFDLLFSAPIPPRRILLVRLSSIALTTLIGHALWLVPIANVGVLTGRTWMIGLYAFVLTAAFAFAGAGVLLSLTLVRLIGAQRTRTLVQVIGILCGVLGYVASQLAPRITVQPESLDSPLYPAAARLLDFCFGMLAGEPVPIGMLALLGAACWAISYRRLDRIFVSGTQQLHAAATPRTRASTATVRVASSVLMGICIKEWRCIVRAPLILARTGAALMYLAPPLFVIFGSKGETGYTAMIVAGGAVLAASQLAKALAVLTVNMEEAPALAATAPRSWPIIVRAKVIAAAVPGALLASVLLIAAAPLIGAGVLTALPLAGLSAWAAAAAVGANQKHVSRDLFGKRIETDIALEIAIFVIAALLTAAAVLLLTSYWYVGAVLAAALLAYPVRQWRHLSTLRADRLLA